MTLLGVVVCTVLGCKSAAKTEPPPATVTVSAPVQRKVTRFEEFTGRTEAMNYIEIRARVSGYLDKIYFESGKEVAEGAPLFLIDPRPYQAEVDKLKAQVALSEARQKQSAADLARAEKLLPTKAISQQDYDRYLANAGEADALVKSAMANLEQADLNLKFTHVNAPIKGMVSRNLLATGNLVQADQTLLTTLVSVDPIYAYFDVDEQTLLYVRELIKRGEAKSAHETPIQVTMALANDAGFPHKGVIDFIDNRVNPSTGALQLRAVFENKLVGRNREYTPGLFVRIRVPIGEPHTAILVPDRSIGTDQGQRFVYVVESRPNKKSGESEPTISARNVKLGILNDGWREILSGLTPTDQVLVSGLQRVRPGSVVSPKPAVFTEAELPKDMLIDGTKAGDDVKAKEPAEKTDAAKTEATPAGPAKETVEPAPAKSESAAKTEPAAEPEPTSKTETRPKK